MKRSTSVERLASVPAARWGGKSIFFSAPSNLERHGARLVLAAWCSTAKSRPKDGVEEGEEHSERKHLVLHLPAAHRYRQMVKTSTREPEDGILLLVYTWKSVKAALLCGGWSELAPPPVSLFIGLVFRGVCPAPQSSHVDSP